MTYHSNIWRCCECGKLTETQHVKQLLKNARAAANSSMSIDRLEEFLKQYRICLGDNHYLIVEMKQKLAALIRRVCDVDPKLAKSKALLQRKLELCGDIYPLLDILQPGVSRLKGIALYEQFSSMVKLAKIQYDEKAITSNEYFVRGSIHYISPQ